MFYNTGSWSAGYFIPEEAASAWGYVILDPDQQQTYTRGIGSVWSYNSRARSQKTLYKERHISMMVYKTEFLSAGDEILEESNQHDVL